MKVYTLENSEEWDTIVKSFMTYDVHYLSGYAKLFQTHGDGDPHLFYYEDNDIRVMNVVMKRDISTISHFKNRIGTDEFFDFITPYGYGGFLFEGNIAKDTVRPFYLKYKNYCTENNIVCETTRFNPITKNHLHAYGYLETVPLGPSVTIDLTNPQDLWTNFSGSNRTKIRKSKKAGANVSVGNDIDLLYQFQNIYDSTMQRNCAADYYYFDKDFYDCLYQSLPDNFVIFYTEMDNVITSMAIVVMANHKMYGLLTGSRTDYRKIIPSNYMVCKSAEWGLNNGFQYFNIGGGVGYKDDSLLKYKASFNRKSDTIYYIGKQIFMEETYQKLVELRLQADDLNLDSAYFPLYRA